MKKSLFISVISLLLCGTAMAQKITVKGVAPKGATEVSLIIQRNMMEKFTTSPVNAEGRYEIVFELSDPALLNIASDANSNYTKIFVRPGDGIVADFNEDGVSFSGDEAANNTSLQKLSQLFMNAQAEHRVDIRQTTENRDSLLKLIELIPTIIESEKLADAEFAAIIKADWELHIYTSILGTAGIYSLVTGGSTVDLPTDFYAPLKDLKFDSEVYRSIVYMPWFLQNYFSTLQNEGTLPTDVDNYLTMSVERVGDPVVRERYTLLVLQSELYIYSQDYKNHARVLKGYVTSEAGLKTLEEQWTTFAAMAEEHKHLNRGKKAFNFTANDAQGNPHKFSEYKGKVVVMDVWDTNCRPCIAEMPSLAKLEHSFEGQDVVFVSLSLDRDVEKWLNFMQSRTMSGIQLNEPAGPKSEFAKFYKLRGIPRFLVFDKAGKIVETNAPRPSDAKLKMLIERTLK